MGTIKSYIFTILILMCPSALYTGWFNFWPFGSKQQYCGITLKQAANQFKLRQDQFKKTQEKSFQNLTTEANIRNFKIDHENSFITKENGCRELNHRPYESILLNQLHKIQVEKNKESYYLTKSKEIDQISNYFKYSKVLPQAIARSIPGLVNHYICFHGKKSTNHVVLITASLKELISTPPESLDSTKKVPPRIKEVTHATITGTSDFFNSLECNKVPIPDKKRIVVILPKEQSPSSSIEGKEDDY